MKESNKRLSSTEIGGLWTVYMQESMAICFLKHLKQHNKDEEILPILKKSLDFSQFHIKRIEEFFRMENIPIPHGFSEKDVDLSAPPLFHDLFSLSFVYSMSRMAMVNYSFITAAVARMDVREFFTNCLQGSTDLFNESATLMLEKGIYDRPPMINYPKKVEYIKNASLLSGYINKKRPINAIELNEIFYNTVRNYFGSILCLGFLQVVKDGEIKKYIKKGKEICDKQNKLFNDILLEEDLLGSAPVSMEVTDSTTSPFSERLIIMLFHSLNQMDVTLLGHSLSLSMRSDLTAHFSKLIIEVLKYGQEGFKIIVNRGWMEQPPQSTNRKNLIHGL
ncbi:DUF3231 family protein [Evansella sp. AB-P1]|uniref:DUF3231 family protein n=1 Tax=Evansella sp. AB-P1 TaxID=3037653 RepID=UPI00241CDB66|nr:DUF3231 family protein [Evansella sp. AB-P1]MDG5788624.1 DUF3231 family protein [Evansella sp. AB-P1]